MEVKSIASLAEIDAQQWNALAGFDYPFLRYEFLYALERSGVVSAETGWQPCHVVVMDRHQLVALLPMYQKSHSWGEYVFDQAWAQAYQQWGLNYYPKLITSIPFTPCVGPRLAVRSDMDLAAITDLLLGFILRQIENQKLSSWHCLFPEQKLHQWLQIKELIIREDVQFQWFNHGYKCFDDYLKALTASKRKMIKRERRKIAEQGIELIRLNGNEITHQQWQSFYRFYALTYLKRHSRPYLNPQFFQFLAESMPEQLLLVLAMKQQTPVAAALSFIGNNTLYGRYWGCEHDYDALHFEACYYQGIEYCLNQGLQRFDSGAQGEHKIARGFEPVATYSAHWIRDVRFVNAISDYVGREREQLNRYKATAAAYLPFRNVRNDQILDQ